MKRWSYDLSSFSFVAGDIGRLMTLAVIPIIAGDSISLNLQAAVRLAALRRSLTLDAQVDLYAFYIPYRHIYGSDFTDMITQGVDETVTLTSGPSSIDIRHFGCRPNYSGAFPLWLPAGYNRIWNEFFRVPSDVAAIKADTYLASAASREAYFGEVVARLKTPWSTGIAPTIVAADHDVPAAASTMDLLDFATIQARYKTEQEKEFFSIRYRDILPRMFGGSANPDAEQRPTLLMRQKNTLSGYEIDATDDAGLGTFSGKSAAQVGMKIPSRRLPEHGTLWIMCTVRFPTLFEEEMHYLTQKPNPSYEDLIGDPEVVAAQPPMVVSADDWFDSGASNDLGTIPFGQWYRSQPNYIYELYSGLQGFPFSTTPPTSAAEARYFKNAEFDQAFQSSALGQWNLNGHIGVNVKRVVPPAVSSIFAGTR